MATTLKELGLDKLSIEDRLDLAHEIWDSAALQLQQESVTDVQRQELERRMADSIANPDAVVPWEEVKARALARAKR